MAVRTSHDNLRQVTKVNRTKTKPGRMEDFKLNCKILLFPCVFANEPFNCLVKLATQR